MNITAIPKVRLDLDSLTRDKKIICHPNVEGDSRRGHQRLRRQDFLLPECNYEFLVGYRTGHLSRYHQML